MAELTVPELERDPFREHYRRLILGPLLEAAENRSAQEHAFGHRIRAARAERDVAFLLAATGAGHGRPVQPARRFGPELRSSIRLVWLATVGLLLLDLAAFGIHSWTTTVADVGLIALTIVWFWVCAEDLLFAHEPESEQLELFS